MIDKAEDRDQFKAAMEQIGLEVLPRRDGRTRWTRPGALVQEIGLPCVVRPSFTLGGTGSSIAYNRERVRRPGAAAAWTSRPSTRCCSRNRSSAGKSTRWR